MSKKSKNKYPKKHGTSYIYCITNKINNKSYIGQTNDPKTRWTAHKATSSSKSKKSKSRKFLVHHAIAKYGHNNFKFQVLEKIDKNSNYNIDEAEEFYVAYFQTKTPNGYNLTSGGKNGYMTEESKQNIKKGMAKSDGYAKKLTGKKAIQIYKKFLKGAKARDLAKEYKVNNQIIYDILNKKIWKKYLISLPVINFKKRIGSSSPAAKINESQAKKIKVNLLKGLTPMEVSKKFNIPVTIVLGIRHCRTWTYIEPYLEPPKRYKIRETVESKKSRYHGDKLSKEQVSNIKKKILLGEKSAKISNELSIDISKIDKIKQGKTYKNIKPLLPANKKKKL